MPPDDEQDLFEDTLEGGGEPEGEAGKEGAAEGKTGEGAPEWRAELDRVRAQVEERNVQVMSILSDLARNLKPGAPPAVKPENGNAAGNDIERWRMTKDVPEAMPILVEEKVNQLLGDRLKEFESNLMTGLNRRDAGREISGRIRTNYSEDIADRDSEIIRNTPAAKQLLDTILDPSVRGTDIHDQLAYLLAAASNPRAVAKREVARVKTDREARDAAAQRSGAFSGVGGGRNPADKEPEIDDTDEEIARKLGVNLKDEKVRARILASKKTERLATYGTRDYSGGA